MAQAIETKYSAPGKIRAKAARGAATFTIPDDMNDDAQRHAFAARELCRKFATQDRKTYGTGDAAANWLAPFVSGCLPSGSWAHVFTK